MSLMNLFLCRGLKHGSELVTHFPVVSTHANWQQKAPVSGAPLPENIYIPKASLASGKQEI